MMSYPVQLTTDSNTRQVECDGVHLLSLVVAGEQGAGDEIDFVFHSAEDCAGAVSPALVAVGATLRIVQLLSAMTHCCVTLVSEHALLGDSRP